jgi:hypothetical protein
VLLSLLDWANEPEGPLWRRVFFPSTSINHSSFIFR